MEVSGSAKALEGEMEVEAFRRLLPVPFYEKYLCEGLRPDSRSLSDSRETIVVLGTVLTADGSATAKIGQTTIMAAIKLEVMFPSAESPDEGAISIEFHMPPICSPLVRPGRPAEVAQVISKQLYDVISSSGMINLSDLSIISGKAAWMAYLDIYCINSDGSLFDAALLSAVAAFVQLEIPPISLSEEGRVVVASEEDSENTAAAQDLGNTQRRKLTLTENFIPFSLTCAFHKSYVLADPNVEEENIFESVATVVLDRSGRLLSMYKPGGTVLASTSNFKHCVKLGRERVKELTVILRDAQMDMDTDDS